MRDASLGACALTGFVYQEVSPRLELPAGTYDQAAERYPWVFMSLAPSYLGVTQGICDFTRSYLRGEVPGGPAPRRDVMMKQVGWAEMLRMLEQSRALMFAAVDQARLDPTTDDLVRGWAACNTVMENAAAVGSLAVRVCGGRSIMRDMILERLYRDCRLGSTMLPWSAEVTMERLGRAYLYDE